MSCGSFDTPLIRSMPPEEFSCTPDAASSDEIGM